MRKSFFKASGRRGGQKRARNLSPERRSEIASRAANARWKKPHKSVRFDAPSLDDPTYLEEVLLEGSLDDWNRIYEEISDRPFGATAKALGRVLSSTRYYGVSPLWAGILRGVQGMP